MSPEQQIDRSVLAGKDRDELHTIAGAIGVKAATRMRKADLIDAILDAANGGERRRPTAERPTADDAPQAAPGALGARVAAPADDPIAALAGGGGRARRRRRRRRRRADAAPAWPARRDRAPAADRAD